MADQWFRLYNTIRHHRKVRKLTNAQFRAWIMLLSVASEEGGKLPTSFDDIALELHVTAGKARDLVQGLISAELLDRDDDGSVTPHNWQDRQFQSDDSRERQRRYRERLKQRNGDVTQNVINDVTTTVQEKRQRREETEKKGKRARGAPLDFPDWLPQSQWDSFVEMRSKAKTPFTDDARKLAIRALTELRDAGDDPAAVLEQSVLNGWKGIFPLKVNGAAQPHSGLPKAKIFTLADLDEQKSDVSH